jgi:hypothetical protein
MQDTGLRWGVTTGGFGAVIGVLSYVLGGVLEPVSSGPTTAEAVAVMVFVRGLLVLAVLGIVLGLAYYAGLRVGMDMLQGLTQDEDVPGDRVGPVLSGGLVMFLYWFATTLYVYLIPPLGKRDASLQTFLVHLLLGAVFIGLGGGLGGLGGRAPVARRLLNRVVGAPLVSRATVDRTLADVSMQAPHLSAAPLREGAGEGEGHPAPTSES